MITFLEKFSNSNRRERVELLKSESLSFIKNGCMESHEQLNKNINQFMEKNRGLDKKVDEIFAFLNEVKLDETNDQLKNMSNQVRESNILVNKLHFDEIPEIKYIPQNIQPNIPQQNSRPSNNYQPNNPHNNYPMPEMQGKQPGPYQNQNYQNPQYPQYQKPNGPPMFNPSQNQGGIILNDNPGNIPRHPQPVSHQQQPNPYPQNNPVEFNEFSLLGQGQNQNQGQGQNQGQFSQQQMPRPQPVQPQPQPPKKEINLRQMDESERKNVILGVNRKVLDYVVTINPKAAGELVVYVDGRFETVKLTRESFMNDDNILNNYPSNCKYVNLGCGLFVCGGLINKTATNISFQIILSKGGDNDRLSQSIFPFKNMNDARERHNLLYMESENCVMAVSGFFSQSAEIGYLQRDEWEKIAPISETRANATMSFINERFVYIIGGYKTQGKDGMYLNSAEYLDMKNKNNGWTTIDFNRMGKKLSLSAMGVINLSSTKILLVGGLEGKYFDQCTEVDIDENRGGITSLENMNYRIPTGNIFINNNFVRIDDELVNFELTTTALLRFDPKSFTFKSTKSK